MFPFCSRSTKPDDAPALPSYTPVLPPPIIADAEYIIDDSQVDKGLASEDPLIRQLSLIVMEVKRPLTTLLDNDVLSSVFLDIERVLMGLLASNGILNELSAVFHVFPDNLRSLQRLMRSDTHVSFILRPHMSTLAEAFTALHSLAVKMLPETTVKKLLSAKQDELELKKSLLKCRFPSDSVEHEIFTSLLPVFDKGDNLSDTVHRMCSVYIAQARVTGQTTVFRDTWFGRRERKIQTLIVLFKRHLLILTKAGKRWTVDFFAPIDAIRMIATGGSGDAGVSVAVPHTGAVRCITTVSIHERDALLQIFHRLSTPTPHHPQPAVFDSRVDRNRTGISKAIGYDDPISEWPVDCGKCESFKCGQITALLANVQHAESQLYRFGPATTWTSLGHTSTFIEVEQMVSEAPFRGEESLLLVARDRETGITRLSCRLTQLVGVSRGGTENKPSLGFTFNGVIYQLRLTFSVMTAIRQLHELVSTWEEEFNTFAECDPVPSSAIFSAVECNLHIAYRSEILTLCGSVQIKASGKMLFNDGERILVGWIRESLGCDTKINLGCAILIDGKIEWCAVRILLSSEASTGLLREAVAILRNTHLPNVPLLDFLRNLPIDDDVEVIPIDDRVCSEDLSSGKQETRKRTTTASLDCFPVGRLLRYGLD